jgi:hypothetical protein
MDKVGAWRRLLRVKYQKRGLGALDPLCRWSLQDPWSLPDPCTDESPVG